MRMIDGKRPAKMWRGYGIEIVATFGDRVCQVMDLGSSRFKIQIFEQQACSSAFGVRHGAPQVLQRGCLTRLDAATEMEAGVHYQPGAAEPLRHVNVSLQIGVDRLTDVRRELCHIDGRERMQPQMNVGTLTALSDSAHPLCVPSIQVVRRLISVKID